MDQFSFARLFRKYRLLSQFTTLTSFAQALADHGLTYDQSLLSHWQNGKRTPSDRALLLIIIEIFIQNGGIRNEEEANELLASANQGYLTDSEQKSLFKEVKTTHVFQVPRDINMFVGREGYLAKIKANLKSKVVLLYGQSGSGKTALTIHLAHLTQSQFKDGVVWLRLDTLSIYVAINYIGDSFGVNLTAIKNLHAKAAALRSHLANKYVLLILDNVERFENIDLLFPNTRNSSVLITSIYQNKSVTDQENTFFIEPFTSAECEHLFENILGENFTKESKDKLLSICRLVGYLPIAVNLVAKQLENHEFTPHELLQLFEKGQVALDEYEYGGKNLFKAVDLAVNRVRLEHKKILLSLCIFSSEDFSLETVSFLHKISIISLKRMMKEFVGQSLIQHSTGQRYRMHPLITQYCTHQSQNEKGKLLTRLGSYFLKLVKNNVGNMSSRYRIVKDNSYYLTLDKILHRGKTIQRSYRSLETF